jgi:hypothetical protein
VVVGLLVLSAATLPGAWAGPSGSKAPVVLNQGPILMTVHPFEWKAFVDTTDTQLVSGLDVALLAVGTPPGDASAGVSPDLLTSLYGKRLRLVEVQFCYDATDTDTTMTDFLMLVHRNDTGTTDDNPVAAAVDTTDRTDRACRTYPVDWVLEPTDMASASVQVSFGAGASDSRFVIGRLTFVLQPTDVAT